MHAAAVNGLSDVARALMARRADLAAQDDKGRTPLDLAVERKHDALVDLLKSESGGEQP